MYREANLDTKLIMAQKRVMPNFPPHTESLISKFFTGAALLTRAAPHAHPFSVLDESYPRSVL
jgi:hypothetical protein